jgi:hypothetical protein
MSKIKLHNQFKIWDISKLVPYAKNSRTHSDEQVTEIARSIEQFGMTNPILVDEDHGIVAGHGRLMACLKLGLKEVPVIVLTGLSESQKRAYVIADNRLAEKAGWDFDILAQELTDLQDDGFDLDLVGFSDVEFDKIIADLNSPDVDSTPEDDEEQDNSANTEVEKSIVKFGDVWTIDSSNVIYVVDKKDYVKYQSKANSTSIFCYSCESAEMLLRQFKYSVNNLTGKTYKDSING